MFFYVKISDISMEQIFGLMVMVDFVGKSARSYFCNFVSNSEFSRALRFGGDAILQKFPPTGRFRVESNLFDILCKTCDQMMSSVYADGQMVLRPGKN